MPNWCYQRLQVKGPSADLKDFHQSMKQVRTEFSQQTNKNETIEEYELNHLYPCPKELAETESAFGGSEDEKKKREERYEANIAKYGYSNWYDWCNAKWGTKWGACSVDITQEPYRGEMNIYFESAWSPAIGLLAEISRLNPTLTFSVIYDEESSAFAGWAVFQEGSVVAEGDIPTNPPRGIEKQWMKEKGYTTDEEKEENIDELWEVESEWRNEQMEIGEDEMNDETTLAIKSKKNLTKK